MRIIDIFDASKMYITYSRFKLKAIRARDDWPLDIGICMRCYFGFQTPLSIVDATVFASAAFLLFCGISLNHVSYVNTFEHDCPHLYPDSDV